MTIHRGDKVIYTSNPGRFGEMTATSEPERFGGA